MHPFWAVSHRQALPRTGAVRVPGTRGDGRLHPWAAAAAATYLPSLARLLLVLWNSHSSEGVSTTTQ